MGIFSSVLGAVAGPIIGGLLGGSNDDEQAVQQVQRTQSNAPWSGLQPYLTGGGPLPSYLETTPDLYMPWLHWAQGSGEGNRLDAPPPMMFDYVRAQHGIGTPDGQPARPEDRVPSGPRQHEVPPAQARGDTDMRPWTHTATGQQTLFPGLAGGGQYQRYDPELQTGPRNRGNYSGWEFVYDPSDINAAIRDWAV